MAEVQILLSSFNTQLDNLLPGVDTNILTTINLNQAIKMALIAYSQDKPNEITEDVTGDGGNYYAITGLTKWQDEMSQILSIQYPAPTVSSDERPVYLGSEDWQADYFDGSTQYLFLPNHAPAATETFRVRYTTSYQWTASSTTTAVNQASHGFAVNAAIYNNGSTWVSTDDLDLLATHKVTAVADTSNFTAAILSATIPETDFFAICHKAACLACTQIATKFSQSNDPTINADSVNHLGKADQYARRAKEYCALYNEHLGLSGGGQSGEGVKLNQPSAEFVDWDTAPVWPANRQFIFHGPGVR